MCEGSCFLLEMLQIFILPGQAPEQICLCAVSNAAEGQESTDTSCNTIHGKNFNSEGGQTLEEELREAE